MIYDYHIIFIENGHVYFVLFIFYHQGTETQIKGKTAKIQVAPAAGYKIDKIVAYYWHGGENDESRKIKNGAKVALKDLMFIYVYYHPVKTPAYFNIKNMENPKMSPFNYEFHIRVK